MASLIDLLSEYVSQAFEQAGFDPALGKVIESNRPQLCQFQCDGAMKGAKQYRKAPLAIATEVVEILSQNAILQSVDVAPPGFINIILADSFLLKNLSDIAHDARFGIGKTNQPQTIVLDFGGPNVAKPLHVGHLRSAIIGEAIKRLMRFFGHHVIGDIHLGDWGLQIGLVIAQLEEQNIPLPDITAEVLTEIYPKASARSKADEAFSKKAHDYTVMLQQKNPDFIAIWKKIVEVSRADLTANYNDLSISFDLWHGESDADQFIPQVLDILKNKNLLRRDDGALVVDVTQADDNPPLPPSIIVKSDGAFNYETTDVATILQRTKEFSPDKIWYVVDKRQAFHFQKVFRVAKKAEIASEQLQLLHLGFGTMNGTDGKPYKTRDGGVMRLRDLIELASSQAYEKIQSSNYIEADAMKDTARKIGIASIKFGDLINHRMKDYVFDLNKFLSYEGKTGSYILYTLARINSILAKTDGSTQDFSRISNAYERDLIIKILLTAQAFQNAAEQQAPNFICENAYDISVAFARFYHESSILNEACEQTRASRLRLCHLTRVLLLLHLDILGIEPVEAM